METTGDESAQETETLGRLGASNPTRELPAGEWALSSAAPTPAQAGRRWTHGKDASQSIPLHRPGPVPGCLSGPSQGGQG